MKRPLAALLVLAASGIAQDKENARRLLESAQEMTGAASQVVQPLALAHIGHHWANIDAGKSAEVLRQAFAATSALSEDAETGVRSQVQGEIAKLASRVNLDVAIEFLPQFTPPANTPDSQHAAYQKIVEQLVAKKEFDRAMEVLGAASAQADYPFAAASALMASLPPGDGRGVVLFGRAASAYEARPAIGFAQMLGKHWRAVPRPLVERGLAALLNQLLNKKADGTSFGIEEGPGGKSELQSREVREFSFLMPAIEEYEPARARELQTRFKELANLPRATAAAAAPAEKKKDAEDFDLLPIAFAGQLLTDLDMVKAYTEYKKSSEIAVAALTLAEKDRGAALAKAREIPSASVRAEVVARIARTREMLATAMEIVKDLKLPTERAGARVAIGETAAVLGDMDLAARAFADALADAEAIHKVEGANVSIVEHWVSVGTARLAANRAAKKLGVKAESLLAGMTNADLALVARIEMAAGLLGQDPTVSSMSVRRVQKQ